MNTSALAALVANDKITDETKTVATAACKGFAGVASTSKAFVTIVATEIMDKGDWIDDVTDISTASVAIAAREGAGTAITDTTYDGTTTTLLKNIPAHDFKKQAAFAFCDYNNSNKQCVCLAAVAPATAPTTPVQACLLL